MLYCDVGSYNACITTGQRTMLFLCCWCFKPVCICLFLKFAVPTLYLRRFRWIHVGVDTMILLAMTTISMHIFSFAEFVRRNQWCYMSFAKIWIAIISADVMLHIKLIFGCTCSVTSQYDQPNVTSSKCDVTCDATYFNMRSFFKIRDFTTLMNL